MKSLTLKPSKTGKNKVQALFCMYHRREQLGKRMNVAGNHRERMGEDKEPHGR